MVVERQIRPKLRTYAPIFRWIARLLWKENSPVRTPDRDRRISLAIRVPASA